MAVVLKYVQPLSPPPPPQILVAWAKPIFGKRWAFHLKQSFIWVFVFRRLQLVRSRHADVLQKEERFLKEKLSYVAM